MAEVGLVDIIETQQTSILYPVLRIATIGVGAMAGPGVLFVMPYILPLDQFVVIAAVLAIAQLMGSLGSFGLDITCPRLGIKLQWAAVYNSLSMLVASAVVFFGFGSPLTEKFILGLLIAWVGSLTAIFHSYSLFAGRARLYGVIGLAKALVFLAVLVFAIYLGVSPEMAWFLAAIGGLFVAFWLLIMNGAQVRLRL